MAAPQMLGLCLDQAVLNDHLRTQSPKSLDVLVHGAAPDIAASGQNHLRMLILSQKSSQQIIGTSDLLTSLMLHGQIVDIARIDQDSVTIDALYRGSDADHCFQHHIHVAHIGDIIYIYSLIRHGGCGENRKRGIFCPRYLYVAHQRIPAFDYIFFHLIFLCPGSII